MFLSALYYRVFPMAAGAPPGALSGRHQRAGRDPVPTGFASVLLDGHDRFEPLVAGALADAERDR